MRAGEMTANEGSLSFSVMKWMSEINDCCCSDLWPETSAAFLMN